MWALIVHPYDQSQDMSKKTNLPLTPKNEQHMERQTCL